jgi:hypothetical protein
MDGSKSGARPGERSKPMHLSQPEPLPWELSHARQLLLEQAHGVAPHTKPAAANPFRMLTLLDALPDLMVLESTLPMPTASVHPANRNKQISLLPHHAMYTSYRS